MLGFWLLVGIAVAGWVFGLPRRWLLGALVLAWAVIELAHLAGMGAVFGGSARGWLVAGGLAGLVMAYRAGLARLRAGAVASAVIADQCRDRLVRASVRTPGRGTAAAGSAA